MNGKGIFIGATGQNVGKTTICLGLLSGLKKNFPQLGFMKPVGQQHVKVEKGLLVDKDVVLFKEHFNLLYPYEEMSPVIFPAGFTRRILDEKVSSKEFENKILISYKKIASESDFTVVEGTGHLGVGSIANLNNARIAKLLGLEVVIIVKGGIGSAFDELALNKALLDGMNVPLKGVILNRVIEEKEEMITHYINKALKRWGIPLIGIIPFNNFLNTPSMEDFETLFRTTLISGEDYHYCHFESMRLVATSLETFKEVIVPGQLLVTPATREDIILTVIEKHLRHLPTKKDELPSHGLILTGRHPPSHFVIKELKKAGIPALYAEITTYDAMCMITSFTAKIRKEDTSKVKKAIDLVEPHLDFSKII
ncbi:MAG: AAA family ATPase [Chlamydiia bacterium]|nr:AAA family ATPase [Chlamydiia bacterium]